MLIREGIKRVSRARNLEHEPDNQLILHRPFHLFGLAGLFILQINSINHEYYIIARTLLPTFRLPTHLNYNYLLSLLRVLVIYLKLLFI